MIAAVFTWSSFQVVAQAGETQTQPSSLVELRKPEVKLREDNTAKFVDIHWRGGRERVKHGGEYKYSKDSAFYCCFKFWVITDTAMMNILVHVFLVHILY